MRTSAAGQSALLMVDVAEHLERHSAPYAVVGAMAAAVHGVVRASLHADAIVELQVREARHLRQSLLDAGFLAELRIGDVDDPIPALLEVRDAQGNRVDLLVGLRGMDPGVMGRVQVVPLAGASLTVVGREDFIAMKAFAGGPVDLADARAVVELGRAGTDVDLLRRLAQRFGSETSRTVEALISAIV